MGNIRQFLQGGVVVAVPENLAERGRPGKRGQRRRVASTRWRTRTLDARSPGSQAIITMQGLHGAAGSVFRQRAVCCLAVGRGQRAVGGAQRRTAEGVDHHAHHRGRLQLGHLIILNTIQYMNTKHRLEPKAKNGISRN
jgi:hypothetical protein